MQSRIQKQNEAANQSLTKMSCVLAEEWLKGNHRLVKDTIEHALDSGMVRLWKDQTAEALPEEQRAGFLKYLNGAL